MATANPPVRYHEDDNYEIELSRVREKIRAQFGDLTDRLKCRERELLEELDTILASYRSYRYEVEIVRDKVRELETMKQRNEEELTISRSKKFQENIIQRIEEEIKSVTYPKEPQLVSFVCESNVIFSEINKLGKLVDKVTDSANNLTGELRTDLRNTLTTTSHTSSVTQITRGVMDSHLYYGPNPYPSHNSQNYQQPMANGVDSVPPYAITNIPPNVYPLPPQQQQHRPIYQPQQQQHRPIYQQQQRQYQTTTNTFPFDAILFYDDYKLYYEFTNFAKIGFDLDGHYWPTSEHYFQAQKFQDYPSIQYKIRSLPGARDAFEYVREPNNKSLVRKDWAEKKEEIMYKALRAKFSQNNSLRDKLLQTNERMLVEDSPYDPYWGIGSDKNGKNRLGELLMKLRTELRNTLTTTSHTSSVTQRTRRRSSSLSSLTTPSFPTITDDEIIYEANDDTNFLANRYPSSFKLEGKDWPTVLHYFVAKKFDLKRYHVYKILSMKDCQEVHLYSRNSIFQSDIVTYWDMDKKKVMKQGLKAKFEQNPLLKDKLLNTGGSEIIEISTNDMYWSQLANGSGRNLMGQFLCEVRSELNKH